jgi:hypothetical protein
LRQRAAGQQQGNAERGAPNQAFDHLQRAASFTFGALAKMRVTVLSTSARAHSSWLCEARSLT